MMDEIIINDEISGRILIVGPDYKDHRGGVGAVLDTYSRYFTNFRFICTHKSISVFGRIFLFLGSLFKLTFRLILERNVRIIHIHGASYGSFYRKFIVFLIGKTFCKKIIYHIHGGEYDFFFTRSGAITKKMVRYMIENSDCIITLSESWRIFLDSCFKIHNLHIVQNIIEPQEGHNKIKRADLVRFLFLGRIGDRKGIYDLLDVIQKKRTKYMNKIELNIAGDGEYEVLQDWISKYRLSGMVKYFGWVKGDEKKELIKESDIFILPSHNEGLPVSILECMAFNKPIISTKVGGIPEVVKDHVNGILISPGNLEELENAIDFFLSNPELIEQYGNASLEIVKDYFPSSVIPKLNKIYSTLLENE